MNNRVCIFCANFSLELGVDLENNKTYREIGCIEDVWDLNNEPKQWTEGGWEVGDTSIFCQRIMTARTCDMYDPSELYEAYVGQEFYAWAVRLNVIKPES